MHWSFQAAALYEGTFAPGGPGRTKGWCPQHVSYPGEPGLGISQMPPRRLTTAYNAEVREYQSAVEEYNATVKKEWIKQGWHETSTPLGEELKEMVEYASTKES